MFKLTDLMMPTLPTSQDTYFEAHFLAPVATLADLTVLSNPYVLPIPQWWAKIPNVLSAERDSFQLLWSDSAMFFEIGRKTFETSFLMAMETSGVQLAANGNKVAALAGTFLSAASAARLMQSAYQPRLRLLECGEHASALGELAKAIRGNGKDYVRDRNGRSPKMAYTPELAQITNDLIGLGDGTPRNPGRALPRTGEVGRAFERLFWHWAFTKAMATKYLSDIEGLTTTPNINRDDLIKNYVMPRRLLAMYWRLAWELPLFVARSAASVLLTPELRAAIKDADMENQLARADEVLARPGHPLMLGLAAWHQKERGPTPYGASSIRQPVEYAVSHRIRELARDKTGNDLRPLAKQLVRSLHRIAEDMELVEDAEYIKTPALESALGLTRSAAPLGKLTPPYGSRALVAYTTGDAISTPSLTLGDLASTAFLPVVTANNEGATASVGFGTGHMVIITPPEDSPGYPILRLIHPGALGATVAVKGAAAPSGPRLAFEAVDPIALIALPVDGIPLAAIRPLAAYQGSRDERLTLPESDKVAEIQEFLQMLLFGVTKGDLGALLSSHAALRSAQEEQRKRYQRYGNDSGVFANPEALYPSSVITVDKTGKVVGVTASHAFIDSGMRATWRLEVPTVSFNDAWDVPTNGTGIFAVRQERLASESPRFVIPGVVTPNMGDARASSTAVMRSMLAPLMPLIAPIDG